MLTADALNLLQYVSTTAGYELREGFWILIGAQVLAVVVLVLSVITSAAREPDLSTPRYGFPLPTG